MFERKRKYELEKHLKYVETYLKILQDVKYEGQEKVVAGKENNEAVNYGEWCELLNDCLPRFDGFIRNLKKGLTIVSERDED